MRLALRRRTDTALPGVIGVARVDRRADALLPRLRRGDIAVLDQVDGLRFVVCGEVEELEDDAVVLDLGDRRARVVLDGHHNPAGYQQPVRATGTMRS